MSKIQKAIRRIEKTGKRDTPHPEAMEIGKVVQRTSADDREITAAPSDFGAVGDETMQLAALGSENVPHSIEIDREALREAGFIAPEEEERVLVDQYRQIKRPLVAHAFGKRATKIEEGHLILVTSALAGDGKTFTCINLALSLAREQDKSVLLVDADVAKGHISRLFGAADQPGLLDLLEDDSTLNLGDTILETDIKGLSVMTAGHMRPHSTELLAGDRMERLIKALGVRDENRIVLFDSSPMLSTSEARVLSSLVGQVVLVVCAGQTPQRAVQEAIELIDENKALNLVLNQVRHPAGQDYYGGGYGYGYGYGSGAARSDNVSAE